MRDLFDDPFEESPPQKPSRPVRRVYSVSELTAGIRAALEEMYFDLWIEGEVSNCKLWTTGHLYFTLKDQGAQIKGVMFRSSVRLLRFKVQDGAHVLARGRLSVYEPKGEYQFVADHMEPRGLGALQAAFDQLKRRLQADGLFDAARKRELPTLPRKIGIVTSLDGAAIRDIVKVLRRRYENAHLVVRPARVQGDGAAQDIARALAAIVRVPGVDVVIVGRGGGSMEDLWAFNEESVARAIAGCPVPVISAVGHETDVTIADFVADVRAATPSNAAEIVVARKDEFHRRIDRLGERLKAAACTQVDRRRAFLHRLDAKPAFAGVPGRVAMRARRVGDAAHAMAVLVQARLQGGRRRLAAIVRRLDAQNQRRRLAERHVRLRAVDARLDAAVERAKYGARLRLGAAAGRLDAMSPLAVLGRGYAVCWNADRTEIVRDAARTAAGDIVRVTLARGEIACHVREVSAGASAQDDGS